MYPRWQCFLISSPIENSKVVNYVVNHGVSYVVNYFVNNFANYGGNWDSKLRSIRRGLLRSLIFYLKYHSLISTIYAQWLNKLNLKLLTIYSWRT